MLIFQNEFDEFVNKIEEGKMLLNQSKIPVYNLSDFSTIQRTLVTILGFVNINTSSFLNNALETCHTSMSAEVMGVNASSYSLPDDSFWTQNHHCDSLLHDLHTTHEDTLSTGSPLEFQALEMYDENMDMIFGFELSTDCKPKKENFLDASRNLVDLIFTISDLINSQDVLEAMELYNNVDHSSLNFPFTDTMALDLASECNKFIEKLDTHLSRGWGDFITDFANLQANKYPDRHFELLEKLVTTDLSVTFQKFAEAVALGTQFIAGNITRLWQERENEKLAKQLSAQAVSTGRQCG